MNWIKKYTAFFPKCLFKYVYLVLPIAIAIANMYFRNILIVFFLLTIYLILDEIITFICFGGIFNKNTSGNDYIKTSFRVKKVLYDVIKTDTYRRFISIAVIAFSAIYGSISLSIIVMAWLIAEYVTYFSYILQADKYVVVIYIGFLLTLSALMLQFKILDNIPTWPLFILYYGKHWLVNRKLEELYYD